ncbi:MAG TPA: VapE domain-containing protein [Candidatus Acidoferrales bacterium]|nr:VapE domain-containing protein [Candidatus Acidoferrales bacterium]
MVQQECITNTERQDEDFATKRSVYTITDIRKAAFEYYASGLRVFPVKQDKTPCGEWGWLRDRSATEEQMNCWFPEGTTNLIAIVCGVPDAGNVEVIDIDEKYNVEPEKLIHKLKYLINNFDGGLVDTLVAETSMNGGWHLIYSLSGTVDGNQKLAMRHTNEKDLIDDPNAKCRTLIETRGRSGYIIVAPSRGYTARSGRITNLPLISEEDRKILLDCARSLNSYMPEDESVNDPTRLTTSPKDGILLPGTDFNMRGDYAAYLRKAGWKISYVSNGVQYWTRPGKKNGMSATFNYMPNTFYVFSTNAAPFEENKSYSPFAIYTYLQHKKDFTKASDALKRMGYGTTRSLEFAERVLNHRYEFKYNVIRGITEFKERSGGESFTALTDKKANSIYRELVHIGCTLRKEALEQLLVSDFVPDYDPFVEYFATLKEWDGKTDFIRLLAETITLKDPKRFHRWQTCLTKWLVATVACATHQKTNQTVLTLLGKQGTYKTTWLMSLLPTKYKIQNQYRISRAINPDSKDSQIALAENFLINIDELDSMSKYDVGSLKSFITQESVDVRRPYGRRQENLPRRASLVASVNKDTFLVDETGNRRFLIFEVESINWNHNIDMDNVYAQAQALFKQPGSFRYWFGDEEIEEINKINSAYRVKTTEQTYIETLYEPVLEKDVTDRTTWVNSAEVATELNNLFHIPRNTVYVGKALMAMGGFHKRTSSGETYAVKRI